MSADVAHVLDRAAELVERGWTQHVYARDKNGEPVKYLQREAVCFCAQGAIFRAAGMHSARSQTRGFQAIRLLGQAARWRQVALWNDHPGRRQATVVKTLRKAAALAREQA
jgi:hypothetical protein